MAALLSGHAKAVLQEVVNMTPTPTCALAQSQQRIAQGTMKGLTIVYLSLLHG
jgi:hypothetical protein